MAISPMSAGKDGVRDLDLTDQTRPGNAEISAFETRPGRERRWRNFRSTGPAGGS